MPESADGHILLVSREHLAHEQESRFADLLEREQDPVFPDDFSSADEAKEFVNWMLRGSYNADGINRWWARPRNRLSEVRTDTPKTAWDDNPNRVIRLARYLVTR